MKIMNKLVLLVHPIKLLLIAGLVWMFAGGNILRIGIVDFVANWNHEMIYLVEAIFVFIAFMGMVFYRLVQKHHKRISEIREDKVPFYMFFDRKGYFVMTIMIFGGVLLRMGGILPAIYIGVLYCGIGFSLAGAGILLISKFLAINKAENTFMQDQL